MLLSIRGSWARLWERSRRL